jgi:hypothetical protein
VNGVSLTSSPKGVTVEANPTVYITGNNNRQINRQQLTEFVRSLSDTYLCNFGKWDLSLFDFNSDIQVNHPPHQYFELCGSLKTWTRRPYESGINYSTSSNTKALTLYDRGDRAQDPDTHTIRIEASFNKQIKSITEIKNRKMKTMNDFTTPDNYRQLPKLWLEAYEQLNKNETFDYQPADLSDYELDVLDRVRLLTLNGYRQKLRVDYPRNFRYQEMKLEALLDKLRAHRHRNNLPLDIIGELNQKVRDRAAQLIAEA